MKEIRSLLVISFVIVYQVSHSQTSIKLIEQPIRLANNLSFALKVPERYKISVATEGLERPRFFARSPDGRLFVTDMHDRSDNKKGRILIAEKISLLLTGHYFNTDDSVLGIITYAVLCTYAGIGAKRFYKIKTWQSVGFAVLFYIAHLIIVQYIYKFILFFISIHQIH